MFDLFIVCQLTLGYQSTPASHYRAAPPKPSDRYAALHLAFHDLRRGNESVVRAVTDYLRDAEPSVPCRDILSEVVRRLTPPKVERRSTLNYRPE